MTDEWKEQLRCPMCGKTGMASVSQDDESAIPIVQTVPDGFRVVARRYGPNFECDACNVAVVP